MKKIILLLLFITTAFLTYAQHLSAINFQISRDINKAKTMIDQYLSDPKKADKADGWYYKGKIYYQLSKEDPSACADCVMDAFNAFKKYQDLDTKNTFMHSTQNMELFDMYNGYFEKGEKAYIKKNYKVALSDFQKASMVSGYIKAKGFSYNGFKFPPLDTLLVTDLAVTTRALNDDSDAIHYYKMLTDANLKDSEFIDNYKYVVAYEKSKNDTVEFKKTLAKGEEFYPKDPYWAAIDYPKAEMMTDSISTAAELNLAMEKTYYNKALNFKEAVKQAKGWETADFQKRKRLKDSSDAAMNEAINYGEVSVNQYEAITNRNEKDQVNYVQAVSLLKDMFTSKHDATNATRYAAKLKPTDIVKSFVSTTTTVVPEKVVTPVAVDKPVVVDITPMSTGNDLSMAQSFYKRSLDYKEAVKQAKGWETADFQKRKYLKDTSDMALSRAIEYAEAAERTYAATPADSKYRQSLTLLKTLYTAKQDAAKIAEYDNKLNTLNNNGSATVTTKVVTNNSTVTLSEEKQTTTPVTKAVVVDAVPVTATSGGNDLAMAQSLYKKALDYKDSVKKAKGWETADFQKRKRLKDISDAAITNAIPYAEAAVKAHEADADKTTYDQAVALLNNLSAAQHGTTKAVSSNVNTTTTTVTTDKVVTAPVATTVTIDAKPDVNLATAQSFYQQSLDFKQAIKQAKGWETADFQKRKKLKDSSDAAIIQAIVYGEAAAKGYEAIPGLSGTDKSNYLKSLSLLQDLYTAKHDDVKAAEYGAKLRAAL